MHVAGGQTGKPPVFEVRPEGQTGKPRLLHTSLLLPFDFLQVDHPDPSANQSQGKVPSSFPKKVRERLQKDKFGMSDSVGEDDSSVCPLQILRHCSCVHLQETLYVVGKKGRGYESNYDRARSDPSWLLMEMPINVGCATLL